MKTKELRTYSATFSTKGWASVLIYNCKNAAEARAKLIEGHEDVRPLDHAIDRTFKQSAKIWLDKGKE